MSPSRGTGPCVWNEDLVGPRSRSRLVGRYAEVLRCLPLKVSGRYYIRVPSIPTASLRPETKVESGLSVRGLLSTSINFSLRDLRVLSGSDYVILLLYYIVYVSSPDSSLSSVKTVFLCVSLDPSPSIRLCVTLFVSVVVYVLVPFCPSVLRFLLSPGLCFSLDRDSLFSILFTLDYRFLYFTPKFRTGVVDGRRVWRNSVSNELRLYFLKDGPSGQLIYSTHVRHEPRHGVSIIRELL